MDTIQLPTIALPTSFGGAAPVLQPGQIVQALVLALLENGAYRLQLPNAILDVRSEIPLVPGSTVRVAVKGTPTNLRLIVFPEGAASQASAARPAPNVPQGAPTPAGQGPRPALAEAVIVEKGQALPRPDGLPTIEAPKITPATPDKSPRPIAPEQALSAAVARAAGRQGGLGPLLANVAHLLQDAAAPLPGPVRAAAAQLLDLRLPLESVTAEDLRQGFARSGLMLEGKLAMTPAPAVSPGVPAPDLKAALLVLRHVLKAWAASEPARARPTVPAPTHAAEAPPDRPKQPIRASHPNGLLEFPDVEDASPTSLAKAVRAALEQSAPRSAPGPSVNPPPPYRGAPTAAQPVAPVFIFEDATPRETAELLLAQTDAALARQTLLQASSLPDRIEPGARIEGGPRWNFEIPLATPQGTAIAQFEISRDGQAATEAEAAPAVWRARFSLDIEPNGPVHALVTLAGDRTGVTLWAERQATAARLSDGALLLDEALRRAELRSDLQVRVGTPRLARAAAPGQFMDRAT